MQVVVVVPARLADLDESHAGLAQPAGHQALAGEGAGRAGLHAVGVEHRLRLARDVEQLGHLPLHPERQLVRFDDAVDLRRARRASAAQVAVHRLDQVELPALQRGRDLRLQVRQVALVVDARALEVGRQEGAAVVHGAAEVGRRVDGDVAGQVLVLGAQAVEQPGPHARPGERGIGAAGVQLDDGLRDGPACRCAGRAASRACRRGRPCAAAARRTTCPVWPCWRKLNFEAVSVPPPGPGLPPFFWSCGLYSKVSICEIAPCMNRKMIRFAFGLKCGGFAASGCARVRAGGSRGGLAQHAGERQVAETRAGGLENLASRERKLRFDREQARDSPWIGHQSA